MSLRRRTASPLFRSLAAMALGVFIAAQALCFLHCHSFEGIGDKAQPSCHGSRQSTAAHGGHGHGGQGGPTPSSPTAPSMCPALKTMLVGNDVPPLVVPPLHTLYLLAPNSLVLAASESQPNASFSRQTHSRDWVFTPLVCLGPAFRSLAPPFVG